MKLYRAVALYSFAVVLAPFAVSAGDFRSPASAELSGDFRTARLSMETNRYNLAQRAGSSGGSSGSLYDEYQNAGLSTNSITLNVSVAENGSSTITLTEPVQRADGSSQSASNVVGDCAMLNHPNCTMSEQ